MASIEEVPANRDLMTMPTYHPEDIIRLAMANPGYGFRRFLDKLYGGKGNSMVGDAEQSVTSIAAGDKGTEPEC